MIDNENLKDKSMQTKRTTLVRREERGRYDFQSIAAILDEGYWGNVGFVLDGQPFVLPTAYGRDGQYIYFHGHAQNHMFNVISKGLPICFTATLLDGFVLAKSAFRHSLNCRSVILLGKPELVQGDDKMKALEVITNHIIPGRWDDVRVPSQKELDAAIVVRMLINEGSAKVRKGFPVDVEEDHERDVWSGVIPISVTYEKGMPAPDCGSTASMPNYAVKYER